MTRRAFLELLLLGLAGAFLAPAPAFAKDDGGGGGNDNDDDDDDDDDDDSGQGRGRGRGRGGDDDDEDDDDDLDQKQAAEAVREGRIIPLKKALDLLAKRYPGRVIDVQLSRSRGNYVYNFTLREASGRVRKVAMNAGNGQIARRFGLGS